YFVKLQKIPLTINGKLDVDALGTMLREAAGQEQKQPMNEIEKKIAAVWADVLGIDKEKIGVDDSFFELGGHSLKATGLVMRMHKEFDISIPVADVFKLLTVRGFAASIKEKQKERFYSVEPIEKRDYYHLSHAQERLYIIQQIDPADTSYNLPAYLKLKGKLDREKMEKTFIRLIERHETLRTSFVMKYEEPVQRVHDTVEFSLEYTSAGEDEEKKISEAFVRPFDLSKAPLVRSGLIETVEQEFLWMVDMHHIIQDGISLNIFIDEFTKMYNDEPLTPLNLQYKDYCQWQKNERQKKNITQQERYWLEQFKGELPVLELPTDYPRPPKQQYRGSLVEARLGREETAQLKEMLSRSDTTLYMMFLALSSVLLAGESGQEDIVIGTPAAGRHHVDLEKIIGMFVNTMAIRTYPQGNKTFIQFLKEVKERTLEALDNRDYQFNQLVKHVLRRIPVERNPLFDVMVQLQNFELSTIKMPGLELKPYNEDKKISNFDMTLSAVEVEGEIIFSFIYNIALFKKERVERLMERFLEITGKVLEKQESLIEEILMRKKRIEPIEIEKEDDEIDIDFDLD
ncbi:MAG: non-ribosomal peptide synthetase, partial [bacterium]|nr:non-ribosomal peptide synthetase [bacterium]